MRDLPVRAEPLAAGGDASVEVCVAPRAAGNRERAISTLALAGDASFAPGAAELVGTRQGGLFPKRYLVKLARPFACAIPVEYPNAIPYRKIDRASRPSWFPQALTAFADVLTGSGGGLTDRPQTDRRARAPGDAPAERRRTLAGSIGETIARAYSCPMASLLAKIRKWLRLEKKS
jgi:hypothetical protein